MEPRAHDFGDFVVTVERPDSPSTIWERLTGFFLHPAQVGIKTVLGEGVRLNERIRQALVEDLEHEFGRNNVNDNSRPQAWLVWVWMDRKVYDQAGFGYIVDAVSGAIAQSRRWSP